MKKLFLFFIYPLTIKIIENKYYKTDSHVHYRYTRLMILSVPYASTDGILQDHRRNGGILDVSMKRDEAMLIPRFIPRNRRSIIRHSFLKTRL